MTNASIKAEATKYIINTYGEARALAFVRGEGAYVWDADGARYLDFLGGIAVNALGHCHPAVVDAITEQAKTLIHCSNLYYIEPQVRLAKLLVENSFADQCFFCNSGAEANESAIKLARKYAQDQGHSGKYEIVTMDQSFHGRTMATITATAQPRYHVGFEPMLEGFSYVPYNDLDATRAAVSDKTCAILVEPIQSEGGVNVAEDGYLEGLREIADANDALLIYDEVQTAMGRLGTLWGYESFGVVPDVVTMAKALGGGAPIGALLTTEAIAQSLGPGTHASTFGGNPLVSAAAHATLKTILDEDIPSHVAEIGAYLEEAMLGLRDEFDCITQVRGRGLLRGLEVSIDGNPVAAKCIENGLITICTNNNVLRFLPPLNIEKAHVDEAVEIVRKSLREAA
ncbi:aspartate aminotransferase family protein [Candidatus Poribacteria bacterium]|jgi:acetylornithine/N-succinyldiaminopimelate aminotransferase|nr:aspartate aminotransferase family protein [Candidatus Poribacteria bacterium]MBT5531684.1 aspartate aminotransferase family protein [Candidatus Poribacteria bacterium]MBT5710978.1 aspartate aminotransferase family protein [Candidatus Poribacteria bacterium]MBT7096077.1 aspartate aminotransferase family protein [Candidatus Poribacteria bacterium]MBT7804972.1 aspartate aminotransferase family protein [Candidatus Poribacteria bacterium]